MPTRRAFVLVCSCLLVVGALVGLLQWYRGDETERVVQRVSASKGGTVALENGVEVKFPPYALDRDTTVVMRPISRPAVPGSRVLAPAVDVTIGGARLTKPALVTIPLAQALPDLRARQLVSAVSRDSRAGLWLAHNVTFAAGGRAVRTRVRHFSPLTAVAADVKKLAEHMAKTFATFREFYEDTRPAVVECKPLGSLYAISTPGGDAVKACEIAFMGDGLARVRVVNNRPFPQLLELGILRRFYPRLKISTEAPSDAIEGFFNWLAENDPDRTFLPVRGSVEVELLDDRPFTEFAVRPSPGAVFAEVASEIVKSVPLFRVGGRAALTAKQELAQVYATMKDLYDCLWEENNLKETLSKKLGDLPDLVGKCLGGLPVNSGDGASRRLRDLIDITVVIKQVAKDLTTVLRAGALVTDAFARPGVAFGTQKVRADLVSLLPTQDLNGPDPLPAPVTATLDKLSTASSRYRKNPRGARDELADLEPPNGLLYANAADRDQEESLGLRGYRDTIAGPRAAEALGALTVNPPLLGSCEPVGRLAYVFEGRAEADRAAYISQLQARLGYQEDKARLIARFATDASGYTLCVDREGSWMAFARRPARGFANEDLAALPDRRADSPNECSPALTPRRVNPFVPSRATCLSVITANLDGDRRPDRVLVYRLDDRTVVRTALTARGRRVADVGQDLRLDPDNPGVRVYPGTEDSPLDPAVRDLDGRAGEEVLIRRGCGFNTCYSTVVTVDERGQPVLVQRTDSMSPLQLAAGGGGFYAYGFGCALSGARRVLVQGEANAGSVDQNSRWTLRRKVFAWDGPRVRLIGAQRIPDRGSIRRNPFTDVDSGQCKSAALREIGPVRSRAAPTP